jgi:hypothetical protein
MWINWTHIAPLGNGVLCPKRNGNSCLGLTRRGFSFFALLLLRGRLAYADDVSIVGNGLTELAPVQLHCAGASV